MMYLDCLWQLVNSE